MRIVWNQSEHYFQVEFTQGDLWKDDMETAKTVGFRTTGPPQWQWYTTKPSVLNKLRTNPPKSGITITEVALQKFQFLNDQEQKKLELKKTYEKAKKAARKQSKDPDISGLTELVIPDKGYIDQSDLPPLVPTWKFMPPPVPDACCFVCGEPLYWFPDYSDICLWCSKIDKNNA